MIYSKLGSLASTQDFGEAFPTPEHELYENDDGDGIPMLRNVMMTQLPSHTTHILLLKLLCPKEMKWFLELSCQEMRILRDRPLGRLKRIQSWKKGSTMLNSQMMRM